jgi:hypothetical protein
MKTLPFPNKTIDPLNITIFADIVLFGYLKFHISEIVERKLPEEFKNPLNSYYMSGKTIEGILEAHHQNSCEHPNEQLADLEYLRKNNTPQYIAGLGTENRNVIETILEKNLYWGKIGLSRNPVITESDLIRISIDENTDIAIRFYIAQHQNLTKEVIKSLANENSHLVIENLKSQKDIKELIDPDVRLHFQKYGSKAIRDAFISNK